MVLYSLSFLLQKECCNTTLLPKEAGLVLIVIPSTKRVLQHNITAKRTKEAGLVLIVIPTTKRRAGMKSAATQDYCLEEKHRISHGDGRECFLDQKKKIFWT